MALQLDFESRHATKLLLYLIGWECLLVVGFLLIHVLWADIAFGPARPMFDLGGETSLASWFSSVQLFAIGAVLFLASRSNDHGELPSGFLAAGGLLFTFLSADEGAALHEKLTAIARYLQLEWLLFGGRHGAWIFLYGVAAVVIAMVAARYIRLVWRYFRRESVMALWGATLLVVGAVALEVVSYLFLRTPATTTWYSLEVAAEEFLEMVGASLILCATLMLANRVSSPPSVDP